MNRRRTELFGGGLADAGVASIAIALSEQAIDFGDNMVLQGEEERKRHCCFRR